MEISGKKSIQILIEDKSLHRYIKVIYIYKTQEQIINLCEKYKVKYQIKPKEFFDKNYSDKSKYKYKYAIAIVSEIPIVNVDELIKDNSSGTLLVLDHIHDPFNLGAILRTCAACGVKGVIVPKDNQAPVNHPVVLKASQGYAMKTKIAVVVNLHQTILNLKKNGYWIYTTALNSEAKDFKGVEYADKNVLIVGNEGDGVSSLLQKVSDVLVYIPMKEGVDSLNVSVATGIVLFEIANCLRNLN